MSYNKIAQLFEKKMHDFDNGVEAAFEKVAEESRIYFSKQFFSGAVGLSNDFGDWDPLQKMTIEQKIKKGYPVPSAALIATGTLWRAIQTMDWTRTSKGIRLKIDNDYGKYHNEGTNKLPKRPFFEISEEFEEKMKDFFEAEIQKYL